MLAKFSLARNLLVLASISFAAGLAGCNAPNPFLTSSAPPQAAWEQQQASQLQDLGRRATALDVDNRDLHTELAQANQQVKLFSDEITLLRSRLAETASQLQEYQVAKVQTERQLSALEATTTRGGSARITANNSLQESLPVIDIPGIQVRPDGDVIRIELPADRLFHQGTSQLLPAAVTLLNQVAGVVARNYPRQIVGIEGHTDTVPTGAISSHQLSAAQSTAVFEALTSRSRFPAEQLFTVGYGANRPVASNATPAGRARNRRVEVVIYPETVDGT